MWKFAFVQKAVQNSHQHSDMTDRHLANALEEDPPILHLRLAIPFRHLLNTNVCLAVMLTELVSATAVHVLSSSFWKLFFAFSLLNLECMTFVHINKCLWPSNPCQRSSMLIELITNLSVFHSIPEAVGSILWTVPQSWVSVFRWSKVTLLGNRGGARAVYSISHRKVHYRPKVFFTR